MYSPLNVATYAVGGLMLIALAIGFFATPVHHSGPIRFATPYTVTDFHRLPLAGLPAHPSTASNSDGPPKEKPRTLTSPRQDEVNLQ
jgi:hypothetical protein